MAKKFEGARYQETANESHREIAQRIRADLRREIPACQFSVRAQWSTQSPSISIVVVRWPGRVANMERLRYDRRHPHPHAPLSDELPLLYSEAGRALLAQVEAIASAYNWDNSEPESDYYSQRFFLSVSFHQETLQTERGAMHDELEERAAKESAEALPRAHAAADEEDRAAGLAPPVSLGLGGYRAHAPLRLVPAPAPEPAPAAEPAWDPWQVEVQHRLLQLESAMNEARAALVANDRAALRTATRPLALHAMDLYALSHERKPGA